MRSHVPFELIDAARSGRAADVERLLEAVWPDAYRLARAIVGEAHTAEDTAQEACLQMFRSIATLRNSDAFRTWFYRIVVREALKQKARLTVSATLVADDGYCEDRSALVDLWRALATLPVHLRSVIALHYFEGLSSREIGKIVGVPEATVRFRLMTARRRLQRLLQDTGSSTNSKGEELYAR